MDGRQNMVVMSKVKEWMVVGLVVRETLCWLVFITRVVGKNHGVIGVANVLSRTDAA